MNHSESINELAGALAKAQGEMTPARMDAVNPFLKNRYADLGAVIQAARKPLADNGLSITQHPTVGAGAVSVSTLLMHASGQWVESEITLPIDNSKGLSLAQSMGVVITYLRRYSLASILGIYADDDQDGNAPKQAPRQQSQVDPTAAKPLATPVPINGKAREAAIVSEIAPPEEPPDEWVKMAETAKPVPLMKAWTSTKVSRETAETAKTSQGDLYWTLDDAALAQRYNGCKKGLQKPDLTPEQVDGYQMRIDIIQAILDYRKA